MLIVTTKFHTLATTVLREKCILEVVKELDTYAFIDIQSSHIGLSINIHFSRPFFDLLCHLLFKISDFPSIPKVVQAKKYTVNLLSYTSKC